MTLQNRVTPTGEIVAHPSRGLLMGNRGCLHDGERRLGASRWRSRAWISCLLGFRGVQRDVMPPGSWTALFFLDEVTALAAGHRPCGYCRRADHQWFASCWQRAQGLDRPPRAAELDRLLHAERVDPRTRRQRTRPTVAGALPDGVVVRDGAGIALLSGGLLRPWTPDGYGPGRPARPQATVELLTPPLVAAVLAAGYRPLAHPTAGGPTAGGPTAGHPTGTLRTL